MSLRSGSNQKSIRSNASKVSGAGQTYADKKAQALAAKNTAVLSYDELERIKSMCSQTSNQEDYVSMRKTERQTLQNISNARVSKWPNTIQAQREKKEADRIKKLEDDEVSVALNLSFQAIRLLEFLIIAVTYIFNRLSAEKLMPRRRRTNSHSARVKSTRQTRSSTTARTRSRLCTPRCSSAMSLLSNSSRSPSRSESNSSRRKSTSSGKSSRSRR